ncbi:secreted RxLR effector protein 161-like [Apium graveolens]|uniref:secreted RxLR effector protein 161-like n=1 Tax=Apium graveolens TaxID=4045 RepID=UPI003D79DFA6
MVGGLRYHIFTRPDIAFFVGVISRFMERPTTLHLAAAKRILRYVNGTLDYGLIYTKGKGNYLLAGYSDSDLARNVDDRKSTGATAAACQGIWLYKLLRQITDIKARPVVLNIDNKSAIDLAKKSSILREE